MNEKALRELANHADCTLMMSFKDDRILVTVRRDISGNEYRRSEYASNVGEIGSVIFRCLGIVMQLRSETVKT